MSATITPITVDFGTDENEVLRRFVDDNLRASIESLKTLHTTDLPKWRRLYKGIPSDKEKNFPWPNASNVVVQLIGENVDILKARILGTIWEVLPIFPVGVIGEWAKEDEADEQRIALEAFMNLMAMEPSELDLYRVEALACNDMVKFGSVVIKSPWITDIEQQAISIVGTEGGKPNFKELTKYDGPRPEKLNYEDWGATESAPTIEAADFKWHRFTMKKFDIERAIFEGRFDKVTAEKILAAPDRNGPKQDQIQKDQEKDIQSAGDRNIAEWDFHECWFWYWYNNKKLRIIYTYHLMTKSCVMKIYNFYPDNDEPWDLGRLGYTDDGLRGYGFAEMLQYYQEELSTGYNQKVDNRTLSNTSVILAGRNPAVDANLSVYPMAVLPLDSSEAQIAQLGREYTMANDDARLTIELAKARCGVDPPMQSQGGGTVGKKGQYSAMGTFSVMQAGNRRVNINIMDFRYLHLKLGRRAGRNYSEFGIGERLKRFGKQGPNLQKALQNIKTGKMEFPVRAATASINKELEKQNDMLLSQVQQRAMQSIGMYLQGALNPAAPPEIKEYTIGAIEAIGHLMSSIYRNFGHDDLSKLVPEIEIAKKLRSQLNATRNQAAANGAAGNVQGQNNSQQAGNPGGAEPSGGESLNGVLPVQS